MSFLVYSTLLYSLIYCTALHPLFYLSLSLSFSLSLSLSPSLPLPSPHLSLQDGNIPYDIAVEGPVKEMMKCETHTKEAGVAHADSIALPSATATESDDAVTPAPVLVETPIAPVAPAVPTAPAPAVPAAAAAPPAFPAVAVTTGKQQTYPPSSASTSTPTAVPVATSAAVAAHVSSSPSSETPSDALSVSSAGPDPVVSTVLYVLYHTVLYCTTLYYTTLYCTVLKYSR